MKQNQKLRGLLLGAAAALVGMVALPSAMGQVIYEVGFETSQNYTTTGGTGGTGTVGGQGAGSGANNWTTTLSSGTAKIVTSSSGTTTLAPAEGSQMLEAHYGTGSMSLLQTFTSTPIKESFDFSFKLAINSETVQNDSVLISIGSTSVLAGGLNLGVQKFGSNLGFAIRQSAPGGASYVTQIGTDTIGLNEWYTFNLSLDWDTLTVSGKVYDSSNSLVTSFSNIAIWDRDGIIDANGFNRIGVYVSQSSTSYALVDDIRVSMIPEPSSIALLALSAAGLLLMSTRRRHSLVG